MQNSSKCIKSQSNTGTHMKTYKTELWAIFCINFSKIEISLKLTLLKGPCTFFLLTCDHYRCPSCLSHYKFSAGSNYENHRICNNNNKIHYQQRQSRLFSYQSRNTTKITIWKNQTMWDSSFKLKEYLALSFFLFHIMSLEQWCSAS